MAATLIEEQKPTIGQRQEIDMRQIRVRDQRLYDAADNAFTSEGGFVAPAAEDSRCAMRSPAMLEVPHETAFAAEQARRRIMMEAFVTYRHLEDAVGYARLRRSKSMQ